MDSFEGDGEEKRGQQVSGRGQETNNINSNDDNIGNLLLPQVLSAEVHSKVVEAFEVFDHENNKTVDVREVSPESPLF